MLDRDGAAQLVRSLFLDWYPTAVRLARRECGSLATAEEVVQESFRLLYLALVQGQPIREPKQWTYTVIRRQAGKLRRSGRRHPEQLAPNEALDTMPARDTGPHDELSGLLWAVTPREEQVLLLRAQGFRYQEVAAGLGISQNTVKTLLARALSKLQAAARGGGARPAREDGGDVSKSLQ